MNHCLWSCLSHLVYAYIQFITIVSVRAHTHSHTGKRSALMLHRYAKIINRQEKHTVLILHCVLFPLLYY